MVRRMNQLGKREASPFSACEIKMCQKALALCVFARYAACRLGSHRVKKNGVHLICNDALGQLLGLFSLDM